VHYFILLVALGIFSAVTPFREMREPPNILIILADDMGYSDIGCFGSELRTPHIDRLGYRGLRFTQFYNTGRCSPTRASLLTGLYPHQAGMGHLSTENHPLPGYRGDLRAEVPTLAEYLKTAGYSTFMTGKWHLAENTAYDGPKHNWPLQRGFDHFFGTLNGSGSFFDPGTLTSGNTNIPPGEGFYYTSAISDSAAAYIRSSDGPFFGYIAYTAPHWPLHAPAEVIASCKGQFDAGWDKLRDQRFRKMQSLGIISDQYQLTKRPSSIPAWEEEPMKEWQLRRMEVYAAMIHIMDEGIGQILAVLEEKGILNNTLIFYLHDNGGCQEFVGTHKPVEPLTETQKVLRPSPYTLPNPDKKPAYTREGQFIRMGNGLMPGPANTWSAYGEGWANLSNTPFREYKQWVHEGGIASPLLIHWPAGISSPGGLRRQPTHLVDILPTCLEAASMATNLPFGEASAPTLEGQSLMPAFTDRPLRPRILFWEHGGNRALRDGNWKLVSRTRSNKFFGPADEDTWELYHLENDPTERVNLRAKFPGKTRRLIARYYQEAIRTQALPWPWKPELK